MQKKFFGGLIVTLTTLVLTGCCMRHDWQDATCTEPKTCAKCGETEGEVLGHSWADATCTEPKTCSVCGATEGEELGHTLTEANYQQAAICTICGATIGEPLEADFEKYGLTKYLVELDKEYDCVSMCYWDNDKTTVGKVTFSNYQIINSDESHPPKEGYEWKIVELNGAYGDENAQNYAISNIGATAFEDYYNIVYHDNNSKLENDVEYFSVNYNGIDYPECEMHNEFIAGTWTEQGSDKYNWNDIVYWHETVSVLVPIGYDGYVIGIRNGQVKWGDDQYIFDLDNTDSLFFRFK